MWLHEPDMARAWRLHNDNLLIIPGGSILKSCVVIFRSISEIALALLIINIFIISAPAMQNMDDESSLKASANLTGEYKDYGVDTNGDGLFDILEIDAGVNILAPGEYTLSGYLYDSEKNKVAWTIDHENFTAGKSEMKLSFDGRSIQRHGSRGSFVLGDLLLMRGNSKDGMVICEQLPGVFRTSSYNFSRFVAFSENEKIVSGSGSGEILLTVSIRKALKVISDRYSLDIAGIHVPPISSAFTVIGSKNGYAYDMGGTYLPTKPNNFTVVAKGVKNLNIGLKKLQGSYTNSTAVWEAKYIRMWVSHQAIADDHGNAKADSDLISPGIYDVKIFGDAANNTSQVDLTMTLVKKVIVDGNFLLSINTTGFPAGDYSISAGGLNGTLRLDELALDGFSIRE